MFQARFKAGDLVLDYSDKQRKWKHIPIVPVLRVQRVTPFYYRFQGWGPSRQKIDRIDPHLVPVPPDIPWTYRREFSDFCQLEEVRYRSRSWQVMEVGYRFASKFVEYKDDFTGEVHKLTKDYSFKPCGYGLQEENADAPLWFWAQTLTDIVRRLRERAARAESEVLSEEDDLPEDLLERGTVEWTGPAIESAHRKLKPGDFFAFRPLVSLGVEIDSFARLLEPEGIATTRGHLARFNAIHEPPTAFPLEVLRRVQLFSSAISFGEVRVWAAFTDVLPIQEKVLYYTNDRIHWHRKLSAVLQREIDRLVQTRSGGLPAVN